MKTNYTVSLKKIIDEFGLEEFYLPDNPENILVSSTEINRPGLQIAGFFNYFDADRIQIFGLSEMSFIECFVPEKAIGRAKEFFSRKPVAVVLSRELDMPEYFIEEAKEFGVPLLRTKDTTSGFSAALIAFLSLNLAPRITRHGVLVEVYGEGILLLGESGVGKSETASYCGRRGGNKKGIKQIACRLGSRKYPSFYRASRNRYNKCEQNIRCRSSKAYGED